MISGGTPWRAGQKRRSESSFRPTARRGDRSLARWRVTVELLAETTGVDQSVCEASLRELLSRAGELERDDGGRAFAFKLHQFIGQGRALFATVEPPDQREFSIEGQVQTSGGRRLIPIKFCRHCGQEYYHVQRADSDFRPHPVGLELHEEEGRPGYLMLAPAQNDWSEDRIPEEWRDARGRLRRTWRNRVPQAVWVAEDGTYGAQPRDGAVKMWWQTAPFSLCLNCGEFYTARERDFAKLASLSSEARSSATTVLATSLLRHSGRSGATHDKLLSFTDNRQDASLQSGHFNDFVHVSLLRAALHAEAVGLAGRLPAAYEAVRCAQLVDLGVEAPKLVEVLLGATAQLLLHRFLQHTATDRQLSAELVEHGADQLFSLRRRATRQRLTETPMRILRTQVFQPSVAHAHPQTRTRRSWVPRDRHPL